MQLIKSLKNRFTNIFKRNFANWGGSGIEKALFDWIAKNLVAESTIVELGSGEVSTRYMSEHYNLYSIEQNKEYINKYNATYIYAPIKNGWYDIDIIRKSLPEKYDLIFVDGPSGSGNRMGFADNLDLFDTEVPIVFHDTYRDDEIELANRVSKRLCKQITFYTKGDYWALVGKFRKR